MKMVYFQSTSRILILVDLIQQPLSSRVLLELGIVHDPPMSYKVSAQRRLREVYIIVGLHRRCWILANEKTNYICERTSKSQLESSIVAVTYVL